MAITGISGTSTTNWYKIGQTWSDNRSAMIDDFLYASDLLNSALTSAKTTEISGLGDLAALAASKRLSSSSRDAAIVANNAKYQLRSAASYINGNANIVNILA